jgi:hypothetical protein
MTAVIILGLLCLGLASLILRVVLFFLGRSNHSRVAKTESITRAIGFLPIVAFDWAYYLVTACLIILMLAYWIAPQPVTDFLRTLTSWLSFAISHPSSPPSTPCCCPANWNPASRGAECP